MSGGSPCGWWLVVGVLGYFLLHASEMLVGHTWRQGCVVAATLCDGGDCCCVCVAVAQRVLGCQLSSILPLPCLLGG